MFLSIIMHFISIIFAEKLRVAKKMRSFVVEKEIVFFRLSIFNSNFSNQNLLYLRYYTSL